jgi:hypothetical protein
MENLPAEQEDKLDYLLQAARHGERIASLARAGRPATTLRAYAAAAHDLAIIERTSRRLVIAYGEHLHWTVTLDPDDEVLGLFPDGYEPLMAALGIDFSGQPFVAGE